MVQRIVINACHGGYGLSPEAMRRLAELQGRECYFFTTHGPDYGVLHPVEHPDGDGDWTAYDTPTPFIQYAAMDRDVWLLLSDAEKAEWNRMIEQGLMDLRRLSDFGDDRSNSLLVRVVEELGSERASDDHAQLRIMEIPDDVAWHIEEYDGWEWVAENHRTWGH